ncbi:MAG: hypothetical protein C0606_09840 [Hyphomicrobiales bacterium]|nr:MAG: hypothetical protein C0606_09840 [Hyphomicrobiales bacterium]
MAHAIRLVNPTTGVVKTGYYGFSWTSFFFGGIPAIFRGDLGVGIGITIASILFSLISAGVLGIVINIVWAFIYNKKYTTELLQAGFRMEDQPEVMSSAKAALNVI